MDFLNKLERKFGRFSIPNLMLYIMLGQVVALATTFVVGDAFIQWIYFNPMLIMKGQIWRLFTYVFIPNTFNPLWFIFAAYLYYSIGNTLEYEWGTFKFNIYYLLGMIFNMVGLLVVQLCYSLDGSAATKLYQMYASSLTTYLNLSMFLAYAALFPNVQFLLYMIIPVKVKYLALADVFFLGYRFLLSGMPERVLIIISLLNFALFFGPRLLGRHPATATQKNFRKAQKARKTAQLQKGDPIKVAFHKCTVCGKTELTDPDMEFRYCSKCNGNHEYCMDHLHNHEHIQ